MIYYLNSDSSFLAISFSEMLAPLRLVAFALIFTMISPTEKGHNKNMPLSLHLILQIQPRKSLE